MKRILVPLDLSPLGEAKLVVAEAQARAFDADLILLHVLPPEALNPSGAVSTEEARARTYLDSVAARIHADGLRAHAIVRAGPAGPTIADEAHEQQADMIVLGSNVRAGLPSALLGSVADEVVRRAPCPVLLVRPHLEAGAATPIRSFADDATRSGPLAQRTLGIRTVEVARIVGSVGRANNLGPDFRPVQRTREDDHRYERVRNAMRDGVSLPPVDLYRLGFGYYVLDGNHRVAAALELGQLEIEADVTEFVPLSDPEAQRAFAERRTFERSTGITRIEAAHPESYARLLSLIEAYGTENGVADQREAARRWYQQIYRPLARRIRLYGLARRLSGERSADTVVRLADFRQVEAERLGREVGWDEALDLFARQHGATVARLPRRRLPLIGRRR